MTWCLIQCLYSLDYSNKQHYIHTNCIKSCIDMEFYPCFALQSYPTRPSFLQPLAFAELLKLLLIVWAFLFGTGLNCNTELSASNKGCRLVLQQITSPLLQQITSPSLQQGFSNLSSRSPSRSMYLIYSTASTPDSTNHHVLD